MRMPGRFARLQKNGMDKHSSASLNFDNFFSHVEREDCRECGQDYAFQQPSGRQLRRFHFCRGHPSPVIKLFQNAFLPAPRAPLATKKYLRSEKIVKQVNTTFRFRRAAKTKQIQTSWNDTCLILSFDVQIPISKRSNLNFVAKLLIRQILR